MMIAYNLTITISFSSDLNFPRPPAVCLSASVHYNTMLFVQKKVIGIISFALTEEIVELYLFSAVY